MEALFAACIALGVAGPFIAMAWAMKVRHCPNCGASVGPNPALVRMFTGTE